VLAMIVLTALGTLSLLTVFSVRGGIETSANDRFHAMAEYAAESGAAAGMDYLRANLDPNFGWKAYVTPSNSLPLVDMTGKIVGSNVLPGVAGNPFSSDVAAWYVVTIYNNRSDTGFVAGTDDDKRIVMRSTGYGPNGAVAIIEWEIKSNAAAATRPCPTYGQKGLSEDNSGRNDCLGTIDTSQSAVYSP